MKKQKKLGVKQRIATLDRMDQFKRIRDASDQQKAMLRRQSTVDDPKAPRNYESQRALERCRSRGAPGTAAGATETYEALQVKT